MRLGQVVHPRVAGVLEGPEGLRASPAVGVAAQRHEDAVAPERVGGPCRVTLQANALGGVVAAVGEEQRGVGDHAARVAVGRAPHLGLRRVGRVGPHGVAVALSQLLAGLHERGAVGGGEHVVDALHLVGDPGPHHQFGGQRADGEADLLVPGRVELVVVPGGALGYEAPEGQLGAQAVLAPGARPDPAQAVEGVERLHLPVVRPVGPHVEQGGSVAGPVERAVLVRPVEGHDLAVAEPAPGPVVPPRPVAVERRCQRQGQHADARPRRPRPGRPRGEPRAAATARPPPAGAARVPAARACPGRTR